MLPQILATGLTVLLVEQDVSQALRVASHIQCLLEGRTTLEGRPADVTPEQVEAAYFGLGPSAGTHANPGTTAAQGTTEEGHGDGTTADYGTATGYGAAEGTETVAEHGTTASPPAGGPGGAGSPPVSGVGLGGVASSEEEQLWSGSTTSSRGS
jgi:hypothetical protein